MSVYNDDVLLIHAPKAAGTSCRNFMLAVLPNVVDSLDPPGSGPLPIDSTPLRHIEEYTGRKLESWDLILCPIRDPYAQVISHWNYHRNRYALGGRHIHDRVAACKPTLTDWIWEPHSDFRVWYESLVRQYNTDLIEVVRYLSQWGFYEYYCTVDGEVPPNVALIDVGVVTEEVPKLLAPYAKRNDVRFPHERTAPYKRDRMWQYHTPMSIGFTERRFKWAFRNYYKKAADR